jgi:hypothetical protein
VQKNGPPFAPKCGPRNGVRQGCENEEEVIAKYCKTLSTKMRGTGRKNEGGHASLSSLGTRLPKTAEQQKAKVAAPNRSPGAEQRR